MQTNQGKGMETSATTAVTGATFEQEVRRSPVPVLVDFWAVWCGPCRMVAPILDELAREWNGAVRVVKVNVDENPELAQQFGVQSIPTLILFDQGQTKDRFVGALPKARMKERIERTVDLSRTAQASISEVPS
ncbi:MAG: thioredoxin [Nitrospiraceae bacterium]